MKTIIKSGLCCCCFSHSVRWLPTRKNYQVLYTVANPARGLLNRKKNEEKKVWQRTPAPTLLVTNRRKIKGTRRIYTSCLGATQVGATQVSVRLASVQGFLRLVG